jgi:hypothetical protein
VGVACTAKNRFRRVCSLDGSGHWDCKFDHLESAPPHTLVFTLRSLSACSLFVYSNKQTVLTPRNVKPC